MRTAAVLVSAPSAPVTAIEWHPTPLSGTSTPLLASGDADGRIVIWDVNAAAPMAVLEDAYWAGFGSNDGERSRRGDAPRVPVRALAWATARDLLAVLLSPGYLVLWDCKSEFCMCFCLRVT
jgi:WD40 repeat protein